MALTSDELLRDRRLLHRRGGLPPEDVKKVLEELPDVADKAERVDPPSATSPEGNDAPPSAPATPDGLAY